MTDQNELIEEAFEALKNAEDNDCPQWTNDVDEIISDLMSYHNEFEVLDEDEVRAAVIGALARYEAENE